VQTFPKIDESLFPAEAFDEALELVAGLPYSARGKLAFRIQTEAEPEDVVDEAGKESEEGAAPPSAPTSQQHDMTHSAEYRAIVERYADQNGKLNYALMNKDFIQFAAKSKVVASMVAERRQNEEILLFVIKSRAALIAGKRDSLDDTAAASLIATLDEIDPRSAFKELKAHINRMLARRR